MAIAFFFVHEFKAPDDDEDGNWRGKDGVQTQTRNILGPELIHPI